MFQAELFPEHTGISEVELRALLGAEAGADRALTLTRNRVSMASVRFKTDGGARIRLHEAYLKAPREVLDALRRYLDAQCPEAWKVVTRYAQSIGPPPARPARRTVAQTAGRVYDLAAIRDAVSREFFRNKLRCRIEWGRSGFRRPGRRCRSIRYGSWDPELRVVRINPVLDDARVPETFVRYIVFHEMLHILVPPETVRGRRSIHPPAFKALEKSYPDLAKMKKMAVDLIDGLLAAS